MIGPFEAPFGAFVSPVSPLAKAPSQVDDGSGVIMVTQTGSWESMVNACPSMSVLDLSVPLL